MEAVFLTRSGEARRQSARMKCHICGQPATGQCRVCWKFYCAAHGDTVCQPCQQHRPAGRGDQRDLETARMVLLGHGEPQGAAGSRPLRLDRHVPRRVVPVIDTAKKGETELTLMSLELYEEGFAANFHLQVGRPSDSSRGFGGMPHFQAQATDDQGASNESWPGRGGGGDGHWRLTQNFTPNLVASARHLHVSIDEIQWIRGGPGDRSAIDSGPWAFDVPLE